MRFLVVSDVALGKVLTTRKHQLSFPEPPPGYDSVHGVRHTADVESDFKVTLPGVF